MLNFNTIESSAFTHSIPLHEADFSESATGMGTSSPSAHAVQSHLNYLDVSNGGDQNNWTHTESRHSTINDDNRHRNENPVPNSTRVQHQKEYLDTVIPNEDGRTTLNMDNYIQQKGSENVKRFSVNNLLQLANNCRALVDDHRLSSRKSNSTVM